MTAKHGKSRKALSPGMLNEALADPVQDVAQEAGAEEDKDETEHPKTRRPVEPAKDGADRSSLLTRAEQVMRIAASIGVATAAMVAVSEYISANDDKRAERSLEIVRDWQTGAHTNRYTAVQEFVEAKVTEPALQASLAQLSDAALADAQSNLGKAWTAALRSSSDPADRAIERDIDRLMLFFAQMQICVKAELCDEVVLKAYFDLEVSTFWRYFSGYAELRQEANYEGYGEPVRLLVEEFESMPDP